MERRLELSSYCYQELRPSKLALMVVVSTLLLVPTVVRVIALNTAYGDCDVLVVDATGVLSGECVKRELSLADLYVAGFIEPRNVVLVTHGFSDGEIFALGLSEDYNFETLIKYLPLRSFLVRGVVENESYLALKPHAPLLMSGKRVVLLTCPLPGVDDFAKYLASLGNEVAYVDFNFTLSEVEVLVEYVAEKMGNFSDLCSGPFKCFK